MPSLQIFVLQGSHIEVLITYAQVLIASTCFEASERTWPMDESEQTIEFQKYDYSFRPETWVFNENHPKFLELVELIRVLDVRHWDEKYPDTSGLMDGFEWTLRVNLKDFQRTMHGVNARPKGYGLQILTTWVKGAYPPRIDNL